MNMTQIVILYILTKYNATIYRLRKISEEFLFAYLKTSTGTFVPVLNKLEKDGFVKHNEKMSDGVLLSKIYEITPEGKKYLAKLLLEFQSSNPYHVLNEVKIALYCSDILSLSELIQFKENILNVLELYKVKLEKGLENQYVELNELQKNTVKVTLEEVENLKKLL